MESQVLKILKTMAQLFTKSNNASKTLSNQRKTRSITGDSIVRKHFFLLFPYLSVFIIKMLIKNCEYIELIKTGGVSSQIEFARNEDNNNMRVDNNVVEIYPAWQSKKTSVERFQDTHQDLFVHSTGKFNHLRTAKIKLEEIRDRPYNIISGEQISLIR